MNRAPWLTLSAALAGTIGCTHRPDTCKKDSECPGEERCIEQTCGGHFTADLAVPGKKAKVSAEWLNAGKEAYTLYCRPCHGGKGKGDGPASAALRPPPRDLAIATYKFGGVVDGLPHDEDFTRILTGGLTGTAMLAWDIPKNDLYAVTQYIKTFSPAGEGWKDKDAQLGQRVVPPADPWPDPKQAIARGRLIYHTVATCNSCHPAYATRQEIHQLSVAAKAEGLRKDEITAFRKDMYLPEAKESAAYEAKGVKMRILPPDFLQNPVRSLSARRPHARSQDLYRLIGAGIPGTAMPAWKGAMPDKDVWAMAHFVKSLVDAKDTAAATTLQTRLAADTGPFVPGRGEPTPAPAAPAPPPAPAEGAKAN